ncbi:o-succinylbenzoate--CoA ligase [Halorubrum sp. DTA98]|uniref:o-succinylbenzoate--CoA ligase n=1 Tax=Halorubrum sp. DTA98 TaxID=3402163 RepID=UPI003AAA6A95
MRDWLSHRVVSSPDDTALVRAEDGEAWTYADLDRLVAETAGRLAARGIGPGDHLGVLMPPYVGTVGLVHAAMRLGATYVPLGERLTPRELSERVDRADLSALVCGESTESDALAAAGDVPVLSVDDPTVDAVGGVHDVDPVTVDPPEWTDSDRLCLLFTSGTTGEPKPVELTVGNVYASAIASAFRLGVDPGDRWLVSMSIHHMGGLAPIYRSALYGTTVVLREGFDPGGTADDINNYDVTGVSLVPTMLRKTLDRRGTLADSLRVVLLGGAPAPDELIERCRDYSIPVHPTYGMTEAASQIATATPTQARERLGTVGRPLFGTDVTIVDEDGRPVERGASGEIVVDGPTVTPGYYGMPDATDAAFGEYGLHTGDCGRLDENGFLFVLNRLDDRIISGGENVEPGEVADVLGGYAGVTDAAVVGLDDDVWGERVAALVETESTDVDDGELLSFARDRLAGFKLPRTLAFTDELPRTVSGTVDRDAVRETLIERGYEPGRNAERFDETGFEPAEPVPVQPVEDGEQESPTEDGPSDDDAPPEADGRDDGEAESVERDATEGDDVDETDTERDATEGDDVDETDTERDATEGDDVDETDTERAVANGDGSDTLDEP